MSQSIAFVRFMDELWHEGHVDAGRAVRANGGRKLWPSLRIIYGEHIRGQVFEFADKTRVFIFNRGAGCMTMPPIIAKRGREKAI